MTDDLIVNADGDKVPKKKNRRWYEMHYPEDGKPVFTEDMGNLIGISGILVRGKGLNAIILSPGATSDWPKDLRAIVYGLPSEEGFVKSMPSPQFQINIMRPSLEEWAAIIRQTDDPLVFAVDSTGMTKVVHRKMRSAISGSVQQKIWVRDGCQCMYCGAKMGDVMLTIDHLVPLELGGINDDTNYLTACAKCNRRKGDQEPKAYCKKHGLDYEGLCAYLEPNRVHPVHIKHLNPPIR